MESDHDEPSPLSPEVAVLVFRGSTHEVHAQALDAESARAIVALKGGATLAEVAKVQKAPHNLAARLSELAARGAVLGAR